MKTVPVFDLTEYVGQRLATGTVLDAERYTEAGMQQWLVRCDCGMERYVSTYRTVRGEGEPSCYSCSAKRRMRADFTHLGRIRLRIEQLRRSSRWSVTITAEYMDELWKKQDGRCYYTGIFLYQACDSTARLDTTASIDRIDSKIGYVPGNVRWVHKDINIMKNRFNEHYFLIMCGKIALRHGPESAQEELHRTEQFYTHRFTDASKHDEKIQAIIDGRYNFEDATYALP